MQTRKQSGLDTDCKQFWHALDTIQSQHIIDESWFNNFEQQSSTNLNWYRGRKADPPASIVFSIANHLGVDFEDLYNGNIDIELLKAKHVEGDVHSIPGKYLDPRKPWAKKNTFLNVYDKAKDYQLDAHLCKKLQILNETIAQDSLNFSIEMVADALNAIKHRLTPHDYMEIGQANVLTAYDTYLGRQLRQAQSLDDLYERFVKIMNEVEPNFDYAILELTKDRIVINSYPIESMRTIYMNNPASNQLCKLRAAFGANIPIYLNFGPASICENRCIANADEYCQFTIDWSNAKRLDDAQNYYH